MIRQVKEMSTVGFLLIVNIIILVAVGLVFAFMYTIAIDIKNTTRSTNDIADDIAEVFFRQNRTALIIDEVKTVQDDLSRLLNERTPTIQRIDNLSQQIFEFERMTEEGRQNQTDRLLPIFLRSFNQTDHIDTVVQELIDNQQEMIRLLNQSN